MCNMLKQFGPLIGRVLLALIFVVSGYGKIGGFDGTAAYMASKGLPLVSVLLVLTIIVELGGGLMIMLGVKARIAATALFLFLIPVTAIFHGFWAVDAASAQMQQIMFMKNVAIMGGLLLVAAFGAGPYSLARERDC